MPVIRLGLILFCGSIAAAQSSPANLIVLPASSTDASFSLQLPRDPDAHFEIQPSTVMDAAGKTASPQPVFTKWEVSGRTIQATLSDVYIWGRFRLPVRIGSGAAIIFSLQRGPSVTPVRPDASPELPAEFWLYNFETRVVPVSWRVLSGPGSPGAWTQAALGPMRSEPILFDVPESWFGRNPRAEAPRSAELQLRFGGEATSPVMSVPLSFLLHSNAAVLIPARLRSAASLFANLIWVTLGVTAGAVLLMIAQVMIPNFRQILKMETRADELHGRLRAISGQVGSRLYTRCEQELDSFGFGLAMPQLAAKGRRLWLDRMLLAGNTSEVTRLAGVLDRIESRIDLTERLDELQTAGSRITISGIPPSVCWNRRSQLESVRAILSRQFVTAADQKSASASLDALEDSSVWVKTFGADLDARIGALRRQFAADPFKSKGAEWTADLPGCADILQSAPAAAPDSGWTIPELVMRDLAAVRLEIVLQMILLEGLLDARSGLKESVLTKLRSTDPGVLDSARLDMAMVAEGLFEEDVRKALESEMWDSYMEPATVTNQDVVHASLVFRDPDIQRSTARERFFCEWRIASGQPEDEEIERGWEIQLIPSQGTTTLTPDVYEKEGAPVPIRPAPGQLKAKEEAVKGQLGFEVARPAKNTLPARLTRGFIDAVLTAIVPVVTVALTQVQNGGNLGLDKLVLIGFTSQAIRAAIVPDSVSGGSETKPAPGA